MSAELRIGGPSGNTIYALIVSPASRLWNGTSFEVYASANYSNYPVTMTEQGNSGIFIGDFPSSITDEAQFEIFYYIADSGTPAEGDHIAGTGSITWDGETSVSSGATVSGEMSATDFYDYVIRTFKRTDKSTEFYDAVNEAIAEIRRTIVTSREEKETSFTDQINSLGDYRMDLESDYGLAVSDVFIRDGTLGEYLAPISKSKYDILYSRWGTSSSVRARPKHYCVFGGQVYVGPVPDSTSYVYVLSYSKDDHVLVTSSTASVPFTKTDYREILKHGVLERLYSGVENDVQAQKYQAFWQKGLGEIEDKERRNRRSVIATAYCDY